MKLCKNMKIWIVGLGLLGGSYAEALSAKGYDVSALTLAEADLDYAKERGIIRYGTTSPDDPALAEADLIVFALYPKVLLSWLGEHQHKLKRGAILTDVTGVKCAVVYELQKLLRDDLEFIAAHPMAGREVSGVHNSDAHIFGGANYIVVPTEANTQGAIELCESLGEELGFARVSTLSPEEHDTMIAFLSQLTHCIAVSLMCASDDPRLVEYTGDSFRDLTRIARINDEMWSELFLLNRDCLLSEMDRFSEQLAAMREHLVNGDREGLREMMRTSTERRAKFDKK